jgi:hypothetical protein
MAERYYGGLEFAAAACGGLDVSCVNLDSRPKQEKAKRKREKWWGGGAKKKENGLGTCIP